MEIKGKGLCVLAGLYFTADYLIRSRDVGLNL